MTSLTNLLDLLATPSNLLGAVSCFLLLEVLRLQTLAPKCRSKLQDLLDRTTLTTKITALLVLAWSLLLSLEIVKWQSPSQIAAVCLLGCLLSLSLQLHTIKKTTLRISELLMDETVAIISLFKDHSKEMHIWFKKTGQEWPPLQIQIGDTHLTQTLEKCPPESIQIVRELMKKTKAFENKTFQNDFRKTLISAGASHPMDVDGHHHIREIQTFLEETLLSHTTEILPEHP